MCEAPPFLFQTDTWITAWVFLCGVCGNTLGPSHRNKLYLHNVQHHGATVGISRGRACWRLGFSVCRGCKICTWEQFASSFCVHVRETPHKWYRTNLNRGQRTCSSLCSHICWFSCLGFHQHSLHTIISQTLAHPTWKISCFQLTTGTLHLIMWCHSRSYMHERDYGHYLAFREVIKTFPKSSCLCILYGSMNSSLFSRLSVL